MMAGGNAIPLVMPTKLPANSPRGKVAPSVFPCKRLQFLLIINSKKVYGVSGQPTTLSLKPSNPG